jgi:hypothetical protein
LEPGETCIAVLARPIASEVPDQAAARKKRGEGPVMERLDFSLASWDAAWSDPQFKDRVLCWWKASVPHPDQTSRRFVDDSVLLDLFERLESDADEQRQAFRFVLGLILLRRRKLRMVDREKVEGVTYWIFKRVGGGDDAPLYRAVDPELDESDADEIAEQLSEIVADEG